MLIPFHFFGHQFLVTGVERTLRRYLARYRQSGYVGLKPQGKGRTPTEAIAPELLEQAILLRREVPGRSVAQILNAVKPSYLFWHILRSYIR